MLAQLAELRREGHVRHVRSLWIASAVALTADDSRPRRAAARAGRALDRGRLGTADPARRRYHRRARHRPDRCTRLLGQGCGRPGNHRRDPRHGRRPDASRACRPLPRRHQQLVRPLWRARRPRTTRAVTAPRSPAWWSPAAASAWRPAPGSSPPGPSTTQVTARRAASMPHSSGCSTPTAIRAPRRSQRRQPVLGRTTGLQPRLPARPAGAARRAHPPGGRRRERRRHRRGGQLTGQPSRGVRSRRGGERDDDRTVLEPRPLELRRGQFPALVAPGTGIRSTGIGGGDATGLAGTSFSAPHVAGALALLLQVAPQLTAAEQATLLTQSAIDLGAPGADSTFGAGLLDLVAAARQLHSPALDFDPPALSAAVHTDTTLQLHADDALTAIAGGEWWADADPGIGAGRPLTAADGLRLAQRGSGREHGGAGAGLAPARHAGTRCGRELERSCGALDQRAGSGHAPRGSTRRARTRRARADVGPLRTRARRERRLRAWTPSVDPPQRSSRRNPRRCDERPPGHAREHSSQVRHRSCSAVCRTSAAGRSSPSTSIPARSRAVASGSRSR